VKFGAQDQKDRARDEGGKTLNEKGSWTIQDKGGCKKKNIEISPMYSKTANARTPLIPKCPS